MNVITTRSGFIALAIFAGVALPAAARAEDAPAMSMGKADSNHYLVMSEVYSLDLSRGQDFDSAGSVASKYLPVYPDEPSSPAAAAANVRQVLDIKG